MNTRFTRRGLSRGLLLALLAAGPAVAQDVTIPDVEAWSFTGFKSADGQLYYTMRQERNVYDLFHLELYGRDLKKLSTTDVRLGRNGKLLTARAVGDKTVFCFYNGKDGTLLQFNAAGQKTQDIHVPLADVFGSITALEPAGTGGDFYLAYPIDADKKGYSVARYGADFKPKWQKDFAPEKGKYQLRRFAADDAHVYAIDEYSKAGWEVACLDGATGAEKARPALPAAPSEVLPNIARVDKAGRLLLAGPYADKSPRPAVYTEKPDAPPRGGFFSMGLSPEGKQEFLTTTPYTEELGQQLNSRSSVAVFTVRNYPGIKLHEILEKPGGGYQLVGETYKNFGYNDADYERAGGMKSAPAPAANSNSSFGSMGGFGIGNTRSYILDFVVLDLDAQGKVQAIRRIPKPYKLYQNRSVGGGPEDWSQRTMYSYRFLAPGATPRLVYLNWHQNLQYVNSVALTDKRDDLFSRLYLDQPVVPADKDRGELTVREFEHEVAAPNQDLAYDDVLPHAPGKLLYSHYDKAAKTLRLQVLDVPGLK
ncbi:hypothetical protein [Hymenobacter edaphi]|uniref:Uncharacterized protein n=1 Tax=Hymenobacter edaphi TaxID=2211146 RepID=A0A328BUH7_9BACT|nr:hypothetical protein [Hymenobacter edaphi]RAK70181.1 hypothetical protein DLM85_04865 [Hymenobacter edaphi]